MRPEDAQTEAPEFAENGDAIPSTITHCSIVDTKATYIPGNGNS
jgi:hypothetical protein